jgi:hypothetical protein
VQRPRIGRKARERLDPFRRQPVGDREERRTTSATEVSHRTPPVQLQRPVPGRRLESETPQAQLRRAAPRGGRYFDFVGALVICPRTSPPEFFAV